VIQETCGHEFVSFLKRGNSRRNSHVHVFSTTPYASAGRTYQLTNETQIKPPGWSTLSVEQWAGLSIDQWAELPVDPIVSNQSRNVRILSKVEMSSSIDRGLAPRMGGRWTPGRF
jgi:hypothetical protein